MNDGIKLLLESSSNMGVPPVFRSSIVTPSSPRALLLLSCFSAIAIEVRRRVSLARGRSALWVSVEQVRELYIYRST